MDHRKIFDTLVKNEAWKTLLPVLNLWSIYVLLFIILTAIFNHITVGIIFVLGYILWWNQKKSTKDALRKYWHELPQLKFHGILLLIEIPSIIFVTNLISGLSVIPKNKSYE